MPFPSILKALNGHNSMLCLVHMLLIGTFMLFVVLAIKIKTIQRGFVSFDTTRCLYLMSLEG